jgi:hypothetical protein
MLETAGIDQLVTISLLAYYWFTEAQELNLMLIISSDQY